MSTCRGRKSKTVIATGVLYAVRAGAGQDAASHGWDAQTRGNTGGKEQRKAKELKLVALRPHSVRKLGLTQKESQSSSEQLLFSKPRGALAARHAGPAMATVLASIAHARVTSEPGPAAYLKNIEFHPTEAEWCVAGRDVAGANLCDH